MTATNELPENVSTLDTQSYYTIEQVAMQVGMTKRTLRYYEEVGLLSPAERTEGNYRRYTDDDIQHLKRIKELRDLLGFSLNDIRKFLSADEERGQIKLAYQQETEARAKIVQLDRTDALLQEQIQLVEQKITALQTMRTTLLARIEKHKRLRDTLQAENHG